ncbi:hypothetical protein F4561_004107 [Lipingzhangella halophila]|uniref:Uncharacterized protein n=1 Tax=Lipingzhangella halophila TaxID=1783352 RepID=A0A7W7RJT5_9ACTN|nr:hypothetical protein [Lipingzhangella halophila]MBB4933287.1 hypothetical protein [Lipingzhangella halophila]
MRNQLMRAIITALALGAAALVGPLATPAAAVEVSDVELTDIDDTLNNISTNVLGVVVDDNNLANLNLLR